MACAEALESIWGLGPQWGPEAKPLVRGQEVKPPEADYMLTFETPS